MKQIKELADNMREELHDAHKYAEMALKYKGEDNQLAQMYYELGKQEIDHSKKEHEQAARLIAEYKVKGKEVPAAMQAVWDWEHQHMIEDEASVRTLLDMFKG